jgi:hypothetical protein
MIIKLFSIDFSIIIEIKATETEPPHDGGTRICKHLQSPGIPQGWESISGLLKWFTNTDSAVIH